MANFINVNHNEIGNKVLFNLKNHSVILGQLNKDYADQTFVENPIGLKNQSVEIIRTLEMTPANIFQDTIVKDAYNESSVKLVITDLVDKSHSFKVNEQALNPGAIERAGLTAGDAVKDRMEIMALEEMNKVAKPISLPSGSLSTPADYSTLEKFMIDNKIKSSESVAFINSATRQKMTSGTTLFAYSQNRDAKFSQGLGGNEEYTAGAGYVTTEYGINFYLSDKLSPNYPYFVNTNATENTNYIDGTALASINTTTNQIYLQLDGQTAGFTIWPGSVLEIDGKHFKTTGLVIHDPVAEVGDIFIPVPTVAMADYYDVSITGKTVNVLKADQVKNFRNFILSNKAIAFACKAPAIVAQDQVVVNDSVSGVATRVSHFYNGETKELTISVDSWVGFVALLPEHIGVFAS